ncbi:unnamed protein product [Penicillium nalgiovense]|uniref:Uncharacterized protein n=1 Tax=Penicillium nalgiovense TaxID=60175 RepID=A0A9W4MSQ8_PENNA|nr:unnamed protein product [Penicillium nalgiovense]CAG7942158.1 unnamed protein product [Penicillium nalgiovense]CAG7954010.1 unnamed protein product [Penicillium nalgiovense]CAG7962724.1 unnamed protein product [Penicillium nalgiovense]CAG8086863.1 unnamed protein product [Penicillium nalgiovense]
MAAIKSSASRLEWIVREIFLHGKVGSLKPCDLASISVVTIVVPSCSCAISCGWSVERGSVWRGDLVVRKTYVVWV